MRTSSRPSMGPRVPRPPHESSDCNEAASGYGGHGPRPSSIHWSFSLSCSRTAVPTAAKSYDVRRLRVQNLLLPGCLSEKLYPSAGLAWERSRVKQGRSSWQRGWQPLRRALLKTRPWVKSRPARALIGSTDMKFNSARGDGAAPGGGRRLGTHGGPSSCLFRPAVRRFWPICRVIPAFRAPVERPRATCAQHDP